MINKKRLSILLAFSIASSLLVQNVYADDTSYTFKTLYAAEELYVNENEGNNIDNGWESWIGWKAAHCIKYDVSGAVNIPADAITSVTLNLQTADRTELDDKLGVTFSLYSMGTNWTLGQSYNTLNEAKVFENSVLIGETKVEGNYRNRSFDINITDYYKTLIAEKADKAAFKLTADNSVLMKRRGDNQTYGPLTIKLSSEYMNNLVSGMNTENVSEIKTFLKEYGTALGISDEDMKNNIDLIALAFASGTKINNLEEFKAVYADYKTKAKANLLTAFNRAENVSEFDYMINAFKDELGIYVTPYNSISNKEEVFKAVKAANVTDIAAFRKVFNSEIAKYFAAPAAVSATTEICIDKNQNDGKPIYVNGDGWIGGDNIGHYIKYDIQNLSGKTIASAILKAPVQERPNDTQGDDVTAKVYSIGTDWDPDTASYSDMESRGVFTDSALVGSQFIEGNIDGKVFNIDITEYVKNAVNAGKKEVAFKFQTDKYLLMKRLNWNPNTYDITIVYGPDKIEVANVIANSTNLMQANANFMTYKSLFGLDDLTSINDFSMYSNVFMGKTITTLEQIDKLLNEAKQEAVTVTGINKTISGNTVSGTVTINNKYTVEKEAAVMIASYDADGRMIDASVIKEGNLQSGENTAEFSQLKINGAVTIRAFVWDSLKSMQPYSQSYPQAVNN